MSIDGVFDCIVVGSGSGGSAVAGRLVERGRAVALLEAGGSDYRLPVMMPAATYLKAIGNPRYDWRYIAQADTTRGGRRDYMPRGKVLGGSSSINGMIYVRGQPEDFEDWAAQGCTGWGFKDVLPYYKRAEDNENGADEYHGVGGPLSVANLRVSHPLSEAFVQGCEAVGLPRMSDLNRPPQYGVGYLQATQRNGWRCSSYHAYIRPQHRKQNLLTVTQAHVTRILIENGAAVGVEFSSFGELQRLRARSVVLAAGALASPQILMLSGVGPAAHLKEHGIEVRRELPGVGRNLQDHAGTSHIVWTHISTYNVQSSPLHQALYLSWWLLLGRGPGSTPDAHVLAFARSNAQFERSDIQFHFTPAGYDLDEKGPVLFDKPAATALNNLHRPASRGFVELASRDPFVHPAIQPNLLSEEEDLSKLITGAKLLRQVFEAPPLKRFVRGEFKPGADVQTDDEWIAYVRESSIGIYHPAGTCKMGTGPEAVVDPTLKLRGLEGVYVADASIMPVIVSGNLNASCIMIGERCADFVQAYLDRRIS